MKTPEQKAAQRARAALRKAKRAGEDTPKADKVSAGVMSERHKAAFAKVKAGDGEWLENMDGQRGKWRITLDGVLMIVVASDIDVISLKRAVV